VGPKVPRVVGSPSLPGGTEGLAWTASGPDFSIKRPPGEGEGEWPTADSGEQVNSGISANVIWRHVGNAALIHVPRWQVPGPDQFAEPFGRAPVVLVEELPGHLRTTFLPRGRVRRNLAGVG
jgi:hypothetical protein